jgi:hypothetical protein
MRNTEVGEVAALARRPCLYPTVQFLRTVDLSDLVEYRKRNSNNHTIVIE